MAIKISDLREEDKNNRAVIYTAHHGEREQGIITSWNDHYVFVRYGLGSTSAATDPDQLDFL